MNARLGHLAVVLASFMLCACGSYDRLILRDDPVLYLPLGAGRGLIDATGHGHDGIAHGAPGSTSFPGGDTATVFDGASQYIEVADADDLSVDKTGVLTLEAWIRPDVLTFAHDESAPTPYIHFMGKLAPGQDEYASRMYSKDGDWGTEPPRPNRISGYVFNPSGGQGAGSYFQDSVVAGQWIHYVLVINTRNLSPEFPTGYTRIFKNGVARDQDRLADYDIHPRNGKAALRIGSATLRGFFQGAVAKVAVYGRELDARDVLRHYQCLVPTGPS